VVPEFASPNPITSTTHTDQVNWFSSNAPDFAWSATDPNGASGSGIAGYSVDIDSTPDDVIDTTATSKTDYTDQSEGTHIFNVKAIDKAGNSKTESYTFKVDTTAPNTPPSFDANGSTNTAIKVTWDESIDNAPSSGIKYYYLERTAAFGSTAPTNDYDTYGYTQIAVINALTHTLDSSEAGDTLNSTGSYEYTDINSLSENWYLYRIRSEDSAGNTLGFSHVANNNSGDGYALGRPNFAPVPSALTRSPATINLPQALDVNKKLTVDFTVSDDDTVSDISSVLFSIRRTGDGVDLFGPQEINSAPVTLSNFTSTRTQDDANTYSYHVEYVFPDNVVPDNAKYGDYTITVETKDSIGTGDSDVFRYASVDLPPAAVSDLSAARYSATKATLTWSNPRSGSRSSSEEGISKYKIYRNSAIGTPIDNITVNESDLTWDGSKYIFRWGENGGANLDIDTAYQFKIAAIASNNESEEGFSSSAANATILKPARVQGLNIQNTSSGTDYSLLVQWDIPAIGDDTDTTLNDITGTVNYKIYRSVGSDPFGSGNPRVGDFSAYAYRSTMGMYNVAGAINATKKLLLDDNISAGDLTTTHYYAITVLDDRNNESDFKVKSIVPQSGNAITIGPDVVAGSIGVNTAQVRWTASFNSSIVFPCVMTF